jgi:hypothetical protein
MELFCTRPACSRPQNVFPDLDHPDTLKTVPQKFCIHCGMPLILAGRYLPLQLLGQGGFGVAVLARDRYTPTMRRCVIKQLKPSGHLGNTQLQTAQRLFEREAAVLEQLGHEHPQIPDLFAFFELSVPNPAAGKDDRFFYLVQEFIDGQTLEQELLEGGKFSETQIQEILQEILKILQFVHDHGSIHRDLKPTNIMRHRDGRLFLLDFGAVKSATQTNTTQGSTGIYSPGFAPPEQAAGGQVYPASDLYALAVTCITLLTGKPPQELFDSFSNTWKWRNHVQVSLPLAEVLNRMLLAKPSDRFQSAHEVLAVLNPAPLVQSAASLPVSSPPSLSTPATVPPAAAPARWVQPPFSTMEVLKGAVFTGFEGGLLTIALVSLLGTSWISAGFWVVLLVILLLAQVLRVIEKIDLVILAAMTLGLVTLVPSLNRAVSLLGIENAFLNIFFLAIFSGLVVLAVAIVFRLVLQLVSRWF